MLKLAVFFNWSGGTFHAFAPIDGKSFQWKGCFADSLQLPLEVTLADLLSLNKFVEGLRMTNNTDANPPITTEKRHMTETEGGWGQKKEQGWRWIDEEMEGQNDILQRGHHSHAMAPFQRAALCFVVGHVHGTLSYCLQYRQRRRPHTRPNHSLYLKIVLYVCVWRQSPKSSAYICLFFYLI